MLPPPPSKWCAASPPIVDISQHPAPPEFRPTPKVRKYLHFNSGLPLRTPHRPPARSAARSLLMVSHTPFRPARVGEREIKDMDEQTFQNKFNQLLAKIKELPEGERGRLEVLAEETRQRRDKIQ